MSETTLPDRVCKQGHRVSLADRTGRVQYSRGKPYMICLTCKQVYESDVRRWGLRK